MNPETPVCSFTSIANARMPCEMRETSPAGVLTRAKHAVADKLPSGDGNGASTG